MKKMTEKQDMKMDKKMGYKENSPRDMKQDKKNGVKEAKPGLPAFLKKGGACGK